VNRVRDTHAAKGKNRGDRAKEQSKLATKKGVRDDRDAHASGQQDIRGVMA
jgi:hypothetical protein